MTTLHSVQRRPDPVVRHVAPTSVADAVAVLAESGRRARPIAGGTDLLLELARGAREGVEVLVDLSRIGGHDGIEIDGGRVGIGMNVTHGTVVGHRDLRDLAAPLVQACLEIGAPQLRNRATVVGNVVTASPANDTISALIALGATASVVGPDGARTLPVDELIDGFRSTVLQPGELVTALSFPAMSVAHRGVFVKLGNRAAQAISVVHAAAVAELDDDGRVLDLRLALGSVAPTVVRVPDAERAARGRRPDEAASDVGRLAAEAVSPIDDIRATADYRSATVAVVVERALRALAEPTATAAEHRPVRLAGRAPRTAVRAAYDLGASAEVSCVVNGEARSASGAVGATLLEWLRDDLGLTGTKEGCAEGECGACTVQMDGAAVLACLVPAPEASGREITTVEGLAAGDELHPVQASFDRCGGVQCGFCTPGFVVSAASLLDEHPEPTRDQIVEGLAGNLCRCTGYYRIIEAVMDASAAT